MPETLDAALHLRIDARRTDADRRPYGFVVEWIPWDSGFRGTGLQLGDVVTAIDGVAFSPDDRPPFDFGQYVEEQRWAKAGARDGTPVTLTVVREGETLAVAGQVRADRFYFDDAGKRTLGLDGPQELATDGFDGPWSFWRERLERDLAAAPAAALSQDTRRFLERLEAQRPRVEWLVKTFPRSAFARETAEDFARAVELIRGRRYSLGPEDLAYRTVGARRLEQAIALAVQARDQFVARSGAVPLDSLPSIDPVRGDRHEVAGKLVLLPSRPEEISEAGHGWYLPRGAGRSTFLVDTRSPAFVAILRAMARFQRRVAPELNEVFELVGRVGDQPAMVADGATVYTGLLIDPVAALVDGKMFVDVSGGGEDPPFAGEAELPTAGPLDDRPDLTPTQAFDAFVAALEAGDQDRWLACFATWSCEPTGVADRWSYRADGAPARDARSLDWVLARRLILSSVYGVRVAREHRPQTVFQADGVRVERVVLEVDPIGLFDGEYRAFRSVEVHRVWELQRVGGGPWKIVSAQGI